MEYVETWGRTIEEAVEFALKKLNTHIDDVEVVVLEKPSKGFFGFGEKLARVGVTKKIKPYKEQNINIQVDWHARLKEALDMIESGKRVEADEVLEEIANYTLTPEVLEIAISSKDYISTLNEMLLMNRLDTTSKIIDDADTALRWIETLLSQDNISNDERTEVLRCKARFLGLKGKCLYILKDNSDIDYLSKAAEMGYTQAKLYLAIAYGGKAKEIIRSIDTDNITFLNEKEIQRKIDKVKNYNRIMKDQLEDFFNNYTDGCVSKDEYDTACSLMSITNSKEFII